MSVRYCMRRSVMATPTVCNPAAGTSSHERPPQLAQVLLGIEVCGGPVEELALTSQEVRPGLRRSFCSWPPPSSGPHAPTISGLRPGYGQDRGADHNILCRAIVDMAH